MIVDREEERQTIEQCLDAAQNGIGNVLLIAGLDGSGKSVLLDKELYPSTIVARGSCSAPRSGALTPYKPFMEILVSLGETEEIKKAYTLTEFDSLMEGKGLAKRIRELAKETEVTILTSNHPAYLGIHNDLPNNINNKIHIHWISESDVGTFSPDRLGFEIARCVSKAKDHTILVDGAELLKLYRTDSEIRKFLNQLRDLNNVIIPVHSLALGTEFDEFGRQFEKGTLVSKGASLEECIDGSFVIDEKFPNAVLDIYKNQSEKFKGLYLSCEKKQDLEENGIKDAIVIGDDNNFALSALGFGIKRAINKYIKDECEHGKGFIVLDNINTWIKEKENGFENTFKFLKQISDMAADKGLSLYLQLDSSLLEEEERNLFNRFYSTIKEHEIDFNVDYSAPPEVLQDRITKILTDLGQSGKTLVCAIDNIDSIDDLSLELFGSLAHTIDNQRVLMVGTYNPNEITIEKSHIRDVLKLVGESGTEILLKDFSKENTSELILSLLKKGKRVDSKLLNGVVDKSGGNPFYITEIITSLLENKLLKLENNTWSAITDLDTYIPEAIEDAIEEKISRAKLDKTDRKVLSLVSVLDDIFKKETILALAEGLDKIDVIESLTHLEKSGLIRLLAGEDRAYELSPQVQNYVYKEFIGEEAKQVYHETIALALEDLERCKNLASYASGLAEVEMALAYHFSKSEPTKENVRKTLEHTLGLIRDWQIKKPHDIIRFSKGALGSLRASNIYGEERRVAEIVLLHNLQKAYIKAMDFKEAERVGKEALETFSKNNDNEAIFRFKTNLGWVYESQNKLDLAEDYFKDALAILNSFTSKEEQKQINKADCLNGLGRILWRQGENKSAIKKFEDSLEDGILGSDVKVDIYNNLAAVHQSMSNYAAALKNLKFANRVINITENIDPFQQLRIFNTKGVIYSKVLELKDHIAGLENLIDNEELDVLLEEESEAGVGKLPKTNTIEEKLLALCTLNYRRSVILANQTDNVMASIYALTNMASACKYSNDAEDMENALRWLNTARVQLERFDNLVGRFYNQKGFVEILTEQGKFEEAEKHLVSCWSAAKELNQPRAYATFYQTEAELFEKTGKSKKALESYKKSLEFYGDDTAYCMLIENRIKKLN